MSVVYLVRHAQASFLSDDYDRLSARGLAQAERLGLAWQQQGLHLDRVVAGPRRRQRDTAVEVLRAQDAERAPALEVLDAFDEYPADEVLAGFADEMRGEPELAQHLEDVMSASVEPRRRGRALDLLMRHALLLWAAGRTPPGVPSWEDFVGRVRGAFDGLLRATASGRSVALFSSAGTLGVVVGTVLGTDARRSLELGWMLNNASVSEVQFSGSRVGLVRYNTVGHLPSAEWTRR
ncbi:MAG: histidine phosphatase family protein [Polyangiaceae bacterium]